MAAEPDAAVMSAAMEAFVDEDFTQALQLYTALVKSNPSHAPLWVHRSAVYLKLDQPLGECFQRVPVRSCLILPPGLATVHSHSSPDCSQIVYRCTRTHSPRALPWPRRSLLDVRRYSPIPTRRILLPLQMPSLTPTRPSCSRRTTPRQGGYREHRLEPRTEHDYLPSG